MFKKQYVDCLGLNTKHFT